MSFRNGAYRVGLFFLIFHWFSWGGWSSGPDEQGTAGDWFPHLLKCSPDRLLCGRTTAAGRGMLDVNRQFDVPWIRTELPGPKARPLIARDERVTSPSYTRVYPLVVARGEGAVLEDVDGNRFLDFNAGIAVCSTGHCHPRVVEAIHRQSSQLLHMSGTDFYYQSQFELAEKLTQITPGQVSEESLLHELRHRGGRSRDSSSPAITRSGSR